MAAWTMFLPADSPDLDPIEAGLLELKAHLRRIGARDLRYAHPGARRHRDLFEPESLKLLQSSGICVVPKANRFSPHAALRQAVPIGTL